MTKIGIFGATSYTGQELIQILADHPHAEIVVLGSQNHVGIEVTLPKTKFSKAQNGKTLRLVSFEEAMQVHMDFCFLCLPHGVGAKIAQEALKLKIKIVDLSADFRLKDPAIFSKVYGSAHPAPDAFENFVYGLPELFRDRIKRTNACANPGCYPTTVSLALAPLLRDFQLQPDVPLIVDSKSGVSGAGRKPSDTTHFMAVQENFRPYQVGRVHRHVPEMEQTLNFYAPAFQNKILFTPGVLPVTRGMMSSVYVPLSNALSQSELRSIFEDFYCNEPFVRLLSDGHTTPDLMVVKGTNGAVISIHALEKTALVIVAIDNLGKGASGQAVQNFNLMMGYEETDGLKQAVAPSGY